MTPCQFHRCGTCAYQPGPIPATLPTTHRPGTPLVMIIGDAPHPLDARYGEPWLSDAGKELEELYLPAAGLRRSGVYLTNAAKCPCDQGTRPPVAAELTACAQRNLWREITHIQPDVIVPMGALAASLFDVRINAEHGIPQYTELQSGAWQGFVLPTYHPNAGMGKDKAAQFIGTIHYDMQALREFLRTLEGVTNAHPVCDYREIHTAKQWWDYCGFGPDDDACFVDCGIDSESDTSTDRRHAPLWSVQLSVRPGTGVIFREHATGVRDAVRNWLTRPKGVRPRGVMHSALHDIGALAEWGITVPRLTDTLVYAYVLGLPSRGLKYLTRRYLGMPMRDFMDVVDPPSRAYTRAYLQRFIDTYTQLYAYQHTLTAGKRKGESEERWERYIVSEHVEMDLQTGDPYQYTLDDTVGEHAYYSVGAANKALKTVEAAHRGDGNDYLVVRVQPPAKRTYTKVKLLCKALDKGVLTPDEAEALMAGETAAGRLEPDSEPADGILGDEEDTSGQVNPWDRWDGWKETDREFIRAMASGPSGEWSYPSIVHVPLADAVLYGCADADAPLRLLPMLRRMAKLYGKLNR